MEALKDPWCLALLDVIGRIESTISELKFEFQEVFPNIAKMAVNGSLSTPETLYGHYHCLRNFVHSVGFDLSRLIYPKDMRCFSEYEYNQFYYFLITKNSYPIPHELCSGLAQLNYISEATTTFLFKTLMEIISNLHFPIKVVQSLEFGGFFYKSNGMDVHHLLELGAVLFFPEIKKWFESLKVPKYFSIEKAAEGTSLDQDRRVFYRKKIVLSPYQLIPTLTKGAWAPYSKPGKSVKTRISHTEQMIRIRRSSNLKSAVGRSIGQFDFFRPLILNILSNHFDKERLHRALNLPPPEAQDEEPSLSTNAGSQGDNEPLLNFILEMGGHNQNSSNCSQQPIGDSNEGLSCAHSRSSSIDAGSNQTSRSHLSDGVASPGLDPGDAPSVGGDLGLSSLSSDGNMEQETQPARAVSGPKSKGRVAKKGGLKKTKDKRESKILAVYVNNGVGGEGK